MDNDIPDKHIFIILANFDQTLTTENENWSNKWKSIIGLFEHVMGICLHETWEWYSRSTNLM